jgi:hypothetical protein
MLGYRDDGRGGGEEWEGRMRRVRQIGEDSWGERNYSGPLPSLTFLGLFGVNYSGSEWVIRIMRAFPLCTYR